MSSNAVMLELTVCVWSRAGIGTGPLVWRGPHGTGTRVSLVALAFTGCRGTWKTSRVADTGLQIVAADVCVSSPSPARNGNLSSSRSRPRMRDKLRHPIDVFHH